MEGNQFRAFRYQFRCISSEKFSPMLQGRVFQVIKSITRPSQIQVFEESTHHAFELPTFKTFLNELAEIVDRESATSNFSPSTSGIISNTRMAMLYLSVDLKASVSKRNRLALFRSPLAYSAAARKFHWSFILESMVLGCLHHFSRMVAGNLYFSLIMQA